MEPLTLFSLFCLLAGAIIAWVIRKLIYENNHVPALELEVVKQKCQDASTAKAVSESLLAAAKEEVVKINTALEIRNKQVEKLISELSVKKEECGSLELDKNDLRVEINSLKTALQGKLDELQKATGTIASLQEKLKYT